MPISVSALTWTGSKPLDFDCMSCQLRSLNMHLASTQPFCAPEMCLLFCKPVKKCDALAKFLKFPFIASLYSAQMAPLGRVVSSNFLPSYPIPFSF